MLVDNFISKAIGWILIQVAYRPIGGTIVILLIVALYIWAIQKISQKYAENKVASDALHDTNIEKDSPLPISNKNALEVLRESEKDNGK